MARLLAFLCCIMVVAATPITVARQDGISKDDRALYKQMLSDLQKDIRDHYYDKQFRGINLTELFRDAGDRLAAATTTAEAVDAIASTFFTFGDSHTRFIPPQRATRVEYGWSMAPVGDRVLVVDVEAGSDAARVGLAPGDEVIALNRFQPNRENIHQIQHYYSIVRPQVQQRLVVRKPDGTQRTLDVKSRTERRAVVQVTDLISDIVDAVRKGTDVSVIVEPQILVWRMNAFGDADAMLPFIKKARDAKALVLDLRGNEGGYVDALKALIGWLFDHDVQVMTTIGRKGERQEVAKRKKEPFLGKLVVLVDSRSASAAECLARVIQLEKRGTVIGDRTAGMVMGAQTVIHSFGLAAQVFYGASVTVSDFRLSDGARLEKTGVVPDELLTPTPSDLAARRDPVLARAVSMLGGSIAAEQAGRLLPAR